MKFATYTRDSYTGLDISPNRAYAATYGRFNTADPYMASGGPEDPSSWNRYSYTRGDPVNRADPSGLYDVWGDSLMAGPDGGCDVWFGCSRGGGFSSWWARAYWWPPSLMLWSGNDGGGGGAGGGSREPECEDVTTQLPTSGTGFYAYGDRSHQYGKAAVIDAMQDIAAAWNGANPHFNIGIGEISKMGGGDSGHDSHRTGDDVDIRPLTSTGVHVGTNISSPDYSRAMTSALVGFIRGFQLDPGVTLTLIFFNDKPQIPGTTHWPGHDNHLHVRFSVDCPE